MGQLPGNSQMEDWKPGVYFAKVAPNGTSQTDPPCGAHTGQKELSERAHHCRREARTLLEGRMRVGRMLLGVVI